MPTALLTLALTLLASEPAEFRVLTGKVIHVADGDTLTVLDGNNEEHKVRLHGIDAPEKKQAFGSKAKEALAEKVSGKTVRVEWKERDRYGRIVGDVSIGDRNINVEMVHDGFAWWYRSYAPKSKSLGKAESYARNEGRGLWHDTDPEPPWEFRKREREEKPGSQKAERPPRPWSVLNPEQLAMLKKGMPLTEVEARLGGPAGYYGNPKLKEQSISMATLEAFRGGGTVEKIWYDDHNCFELWFDDAECLVSWHKRASFSIEYRPPDQRK